MNLEELKLKQEQIRNKNWKILTDRQKFWTLMYVYIIHVDFKDRFDYIETFNFLKMQIDTINLPDFIRTSTPEQLREEAYIIINQPLPEKKYGPVFMTNDLSGYEPKELA